MAAAVLPRVNGHTLHDENNNSSSMRENPLDHSNEDSSLYINPLARYSKQIQEQQLHIGRVSSRDGIEWQSSRASNNLNGEDSSCAHVKERVKQKIGDGMVKVTPDTVLDELNSSKSTGRRNGQQENGNGLQLRMNGHSDDEDDTRISYARPSKPESRINGRQTVAAPPSLPLQELSQTESVSSGSHETVPTLSTSTTEDTANSSPEAAAKVSNRSRETTQELQDRSHTPDTLLHNNSLTDSTASSARNTTTPPRMAGPNPTMYLVGSALSTSSTSVLPGGRSPRAAALSFSSSSNGSSSGSPPRKKGGMPSLAALHTNSSPTIPQATIIPPTPPNGATTFTPASPAANNAAFDAKNAYLSPDQMRKTMPGHTRSLSYTNGLPGSPQASTSASPSTTSAMLAPSSYPPRRSSLLANVSSQSPILGSSSSVKRSLSPRRGLSFRNTISQAQQEVLYDEPLSIEQQAEQQRSADELNENIARQAEAIRKERLSKRIETQKAHDKALAALLRDDKGLSPVSPDLGTVGSPSSPTGTEFSTSAANKERKGKERERDSTSGGIAGSNRDTWDSITSAQNGVQPSSPVSATSQAWASSPIAGEKAQLRAGPDPTISGVGVMVDKQAMSGQGGTTLAGGKEKEPPEPDRVLVGNLIGEDHVNYVMMYNMLTGIRIGVSRCEAKVRRPLTDDDYTARHKFSFDIVGNELTPSAKYDFKFKDYAPWVFRELREYFHLDPADYLLSLTAKYILSELGSPGKSGSFFYFSRDYRFIIKTISHTEHKFLRKILKDYHKHVLDNPNTLISRFYGLHRVKLPHGRKIHFVIMNNLFPPHRDIHETYDLKGSSIGREYPEEQAAKNPRGTLKDLNWIHRKRDLDFGPTKRHLFEEQLQRDVVLLKRLGIMDYSLLVGIHDMARGNSENLRDGMLTVFKPETGSKLRRRPTQRGELEDASALRRAVQRSDPKALGQEGGLKLPSQDRSERRYFLFYQDEGGVRATDEQDQLENMIYYLGIIDILTPYNWYKKIEHAWRSMQYDGHRISAVPPGEYGDRFLGFLYSIIRGGDVSRRPKME